MAGHGTAAAFDWALVGIGAGSAGRSSAPSTRRRPHHLVAAPVLQAPPQQRLRAQAGQGGVARRRRSATGSRRCRPERSVESDDGLAIERDFDELVPLSNTALEEDKDGSGRRCSSARRPTSPTRRRRRPGAAVTSFTFSAHTVGGPLVGAVRLTSSSAPSKTAEERSRASRPGQQGRSRGQPKAIVSRARKHRRRDLTLPAAVAMSGAAISPSMGKMTPRPLHLPDGAGQPAARRLGAEPALGAPSPTATTAAAAPVRQAAPLLPALRAARAQPGRRQVPLRDRRRALREPGPGRAAAPRLHRDLLPRRQRGRRRRAEFETLGDAIALARSELGVEIEFKTKRRSPRSCRPATARRARRKTRRTWRNATSSPRRSSIHARDGEAGATGTLVYVRNTMTDERPGTSAPTTNPTRASPTTRPSTSSTPTRNSRPTGCSGSRPARDADEAAAPELSRGVRLGDGAFERRADRGAAGRAERLGARRARRSRKRFGCGDFVGSVKFVESLVEPAEAMGHHPDLEISWDTVTVTISTHSEGGLTAADFELAGKVDALSPTS